MNLKKFPKLFLTSILTFSCLLPSPSWAAKKKVLKVGLVLRLRDQFNDSIHAIQAGIKTAKVLFEQKHPTISIDLRTYPHGRELESVKTATQNAIEDGVPAIIGGEMSEEGFVIAETIKNKPIVFITPTATNPRITEDRPFAFRGCFSDTQAAMQLAKFVLHDLKPQKLGVVHNVGSIFTDYLTDEFRRDLEGLISITPRSSYPRIFEEKYIRDTRDFKRMIKSFKENKVTHVVIFSDQEHFVNFATEAAENDFYPVYMGSDAWGSNHVIFDNLLKRIPNQDRFLAYRYSYWKEDLVTPMTHSFKSAHYSIHGIAPSPWAAVAFDSAWALFSAMNRAKNSENGNQIREEMQRMKPVSLVTTQSFKFEDSNTPKRNLEIYRIDSKGIRFESSIK